MICFLQEFGGLAFVNVGMSVWFCLQKYLFWAIICIIVGKNIHFWQECMLFVAGVCLMVCRSVFFLLAGMCVSNKL